MSSISQPTAGDPLTWTRPERQVADTRPPRVVMDLATERAGTDRMDAAGAGLVRGFSVLARPGSGVVAGLGPLAPDLDVDVDEDEGCGPGETVLSRSPGCCE